MKINFLKPAAYLILLFGVMFADISCEKEPEAMTLPPAESLSMDWNLFPDTAAMKSAEITELTKNELGQIGSNHCYME